ncbi:MAG: superfamily I DNA/RNA helicase [Richelia sp. RM2_1_2]|nr:superfamily I DNA/RNA helicase [Richelia sp. RM2_1_2]
MQSSEKLIQIVQAWLSYIRLEELTTAEVERGSNAYPKIIDTCVQLVGNKLMLDNSLFKQLCSQQAAVNRSNNKEFQIAVAFPQIYIVQGRAREQKIKYLPLFTIDISQIFRGKYRKTGWELTEFEFQPVIVNLMRLYGLEEEVAESLIVAEGILKFFSDTWQRKFSTINDFIDQVDLPDGNYKAGRQPYLLRCDFVPYNAQLKQDLRDILKQLQDTPDDCKWLVDNHPAVEYICNSPKPPEHEAMFWGAFPSHPPDSFQASALKHAQHNPITAVHGPPGTGKTELFLHLVAQQVVVRALRIVRGKEDASNLTLFASTNNSAIQKFQQRLIEKFPTEHFYLDGGSQGVIKRSTLPKLQQAQDWLRTTEFNQETWEQAKLDLLSAENEIQQLIDQDSFNESQQTASKEQLSQLDAQIQTLNNEIAGLHSELQEDSEQLSNLGDYADFPSYAYQQIKEGLSRAERELPKQSDSITKRAFDLINFTSDKLVFKRLANHINAAVLNTLTTAYPFQLPLDREGLAASQMEVNQKLLSSQQWQNINPKVTAIQTQLTTLNQQLNLKQTHYQQLQTQLDSYPIEDFYSRFYRDYHSQQIQLFQRAFSFLQQETLRRKDKVMQAVETYGSALTGDGDALLKLETEAYYIYRDLSLIFPVISSSLQSIRNMLPTLHSNSIALALADEAGTTLIHQLFPLLVRSKLAVVAGDPKQIEPIINLCDDTIKQYLKTAFLEQGMTNEDYYRYAPTAKYTATAYHRAAGANGTEGDLGTGIVLRNHYRCVAPIIQFCSPNYKDGLQILSNYDSSTQQPHLLAYHVQGSHINNTNPEEIDAVEKAIAFLLENGYSTEEDDTNKAIGVMSPFTRQANALRYRLTNRWQNFSWDDIGTVHTFQGGEKAAIILSPYQCHQEHSFWFLNRKPNLLNTAVSRARELFVLVGNLEELKRAGGETKRLVEHIEQHGKIRSTSS